MAHSPELPAAPISASSNSANTAVRALGDLPVKGRAPKTGYSRDEFGQTWTDDVSVDGGHNGCGTRDDILRRNMIEMVVKPNSGGCVVLSGRLSDPYTGREIQFIRGPESSAVQVDHVVALGDSWQKGAQQLTAEERVALANDPLELLAVDGATNSAKGDADAASWLPPNMRPDAQRRRIDRDRAAVTSLPRCPSSMISARGASAVSWSTHGNLSDRPWVWRDPRAA